jgi:hypothetical protein
MKKQTVAAAPTRRKRTLVKRLLWGVAGLLALMALSISVALYVVFTPERLTPLVMQFANDNLKARFDCESVELTFYSTFPNFGIRLRNGSVVVAAADSLPDGPQDTLLTFRDFSVSLNPLALYRKNQLIINHARLERPVVYAYVRPDGTANWEIFPTDDAMDMAPPSDSTTVAPSSDSATALPAITVKSVQIIDAGIVYDNRQTAFFLATDSLQLRAKGTLTDVHLALRVKAVTTLYEEQAYTSQLPLTLAAHVLSDSAYQQFLIEPSVLSIGIMDFDMKGAVQRDTSFLRTKVALDFGLHASSLADLMAALPAHLLDTKQLTASGALDFSGRVDGYFGAGEYPVCSVSLQLKDGAVIHKKHPEYPLIQKIEVEGHAEIDWMKKIPSYIQVNRLFLQNAAAQLSVSGSFHDIFTQPFIDAKISGDIDFNRLWPHLPVDTTMTAGGAVSAEVSGNFFLDDLLASNYGKINATGHIDINDVAFRYPQEGIEVVAPLAKIRLGSHVTDSIRGRQIASLFRANVSFDSLEVQWKEALSLKAGQLTATFRTAEPKDSSSIVEMTAFARLSNLHLTTADSSRLRATRISAMGRLAPLAGHPEKPEWTTRLSLDSLRGRMNGFAGRINNTALTLKLQQREARARRTTQWTAADSLRRRARMDSLVNANRNTTAVAFRLSDGEAKEFLSKWEVAGSFTSQSISLRTPYFPLRTRLSESSATFTTGHLALTRTRLQAGHSEMQLSGDIEGIRRALLYNGRITARIAVTADSADCNEMIRALAAGSAYSAKSGQQQDSIAQRVLDESADLQAPTDTLPGLFVIPRNIDLELNTSMKKVRYGKLKIDEANGKMIVRNRTLQIPLLKIKSDLGNVDLSMVYKAPTTKGAYTGMDIYMERIHIKELIGSIPMLDSLTPMMRAFEGMVECNITAVTELDSLSNVVIPKTTASCYINGKNMVLLDGETFSTIAKKLYFKNKNRNLIDSISVELVLEDSKILVFPFMLSIDRYTAAVGGTQNLDLSFQYHISILKWPIPLIKIGLNLWGNPDDIHYALASRKYADLSTPVKEQSLESTVVNVRRQLHESLRKSIDDILNEAPERTARVRPLPIGNDAKESLFELDTTRVETPLAADSLLSPQNQGMVGLVD